MQANIVEVRQYLLHPSRRDELIAIFDREFVEPQEDAGMAILGQFRVDDEPDRFFWVRGFPDMHARGQALERFYGGPVWKAHRDAANATMIDSDDVLLLHPAAPKGAFSPANGSRPALGATPSEAKTFVASMYHFRSPVENEFTAYFEAIVAPTMSALGMTIVAYLVTERHENTFPKLPVRENENTFVSFATVPDESSFQQYLGKTREWQSTGNGFAALLREPVEIKKLFPTARSALR